MTTARVLNTSFLLCLSGFLSAQRIVDTSMIPCDSDSGRVRVTPLYSDSLCSSFLICIPGEVPAHFHKEHTENVVVLEGTGTMTLGDSIFTISTGHTIIIPKGTPHSVLRTSALPLRVISVQSPHFDGSDRIMIGP